MQRRIISNDSDLPITVNCERKGRRYTKEKAHYCAYMDCTKCKNRSWYDETYCNNQHIHFIEKDNTKTIHVYCENYEVNND